MNKKALSLLGLLRTSDDGGGKLTENTVKPAYPYVENSPVSSIRGYGSLYTVSKHIAMV